MGGLSGCAVGVVKYILFFANVLFVLSGIAIIAVGAIAQAKFTDYHGLLQGKFSAGAIFLIVVGAIIFIIAFFGCCGAIQENRCMLLTYGGLLVCIFIAEISLGIWALSSPGQGEQLIEKKDMLSFFETEYTHNLQNRTSVTFDLLQKSLECCGVDSSLDYTLKLQPPMILLPETCCEHGPKGNLLPCNAGTAFKTGCYSAFVDFLNKTFNMVGIVAISVACIEVLTIIFAFCLAGHYRN